MNCGQHSSFGSFRAEQSEKQNPNTPVELDSRVIPLNPLVSAHGLDNERQDLHFGKVMHPLPTLPVIPVVLPRQRRSQSSSAAASIKSSQTGISKRSLRTFLGRNASLDAPFSCQPATFDEANTSAGTVKIRPQAANSKRRRRQTPYKVPIPLVADLGRHAPLEPLVLHHRREVTGSDVDPLPPHVDINNNINEAATLLAINEYFDSQEAHQQSTELHGVSSSIPETPLDQAHSISSPLQSSKDEPAPPKADHPAPEETTPSLPERNPERLSRMNTPNTPISLHLPKTASSLSVHSDFTSAARGQYSPYDERTDTIPKSLQRKPLTASPQEHGRSTSSTSVKLAPRILGHEELASSRLNDFNYFLRMTGPSPTHEAKAVPKKGKRGLKVMKVRSRKEGKNFTSSPCPRDEQSQVPACCLEETTKAGGVKHLRIKIPGEEVDEQMASLTESPTWTENILQPLGSEDLELALNPVRSTSRASKSRSHKSGAISPMDVLSHNHPLLLSRREATRSRKLRDLQKAKGRTVGDVEGGAKENDGEDNTQKLKWLVGELAEGLRVAAGLQGDLGPEEVLEAWRDGRERRHTGFCG
ncbi:hypothetical protein SLS60_004994 [Paraconiothyrium brasiliense]|uniref:Uncharacterized protein n=1 Tax=Paraconiothyrium brasiliense TaxID=300254 RepID=A0ABR3RMU4_9PLEO